MPYADNGGVRLYYETHGRGEPLLLIPGFGCTTHIYQHQTPAFAQRFRVIVYDPRGAARSSAPPSGWTMRDYADDAAAVLDAARAEEAFVLGTSFGGMVAQHLALEHPGRVRRLVLGCTTPGGAAHVSPPPAQIALFLASGDEPDPAKAVRMRYPLHYSDEYAAEHDDEIVARALADQEWRCSPEGRAGQLAAMRTHDVAGRLPSLAAPTLVAHGEHDGVIPAENARTLASRIPSAMLRIYAGARHVFFIERADEFNRDVLEFLTA
ncbi:MAG TPA: alpha/beta hydrolase [Dehalococcoidia bacterium]|nr:alpha/beta hydrolase [Dehalococcoidia bacterium]